MARAIVADKKYKLAVYKNLKVGHKPPHLVPFLTNCWYGDEVPKDRRGNPLPPVVACYREFSPAVDEANQMALQMRQLGRQMTWSHAVRTFMVRYAAGNAFATAKAFGLVDDKTTMWEFQWDILKQRYFSGAEFNNTTPTAAVPTEHAPTAHPPPPLSCEMRETGLGLVTPGRRLTTCIPTGTSLEQGIGTYRHRNPPPYPRHRICTFGITSQVCSSTSRTDAWHTLGLGTSYVGFTLGRGWRNTLSGRVSLDSELCYAMWLTFLMRKRLGSLNIVNAGLLCGTAESQTASLLDIPIGTVLLRRHVSGSVGTCGSSIFRLVDTRCIRTTRTHACE